MSNLSNIESFNILVKLTARAFYGEIGDNEPCFRDRTNNNKATSKGEFFLNVLTRYQWVSETDLAKDLFLFVEIIKPIMTFLHKKKLVKRDQKAEIVKTVKRLHAAGADAQHDGREGDEKTLTLFNEVVFHTYWCLDYGQIYSVARDKTNCLKIKLGNELYSKRRTLKHLCPNCKERYTTMNAEWLLSDDGETVVSDKCDGQSVVESDKLVTQGAGENVDNNVNCCEKLNEVLQKIEEYLIPLVKQLDRVQEMAVPDFGTLAARDEVETKTIIIYDAQIPMRNSFKQRQKQVQIDAVIRGVEELKLVKQVNSSNKKIKMDVTSDPSGNKKNSQISAINRRVQELKLVKQYANSSNNKSKMDVTSDLSGNKIRSQIDLETYHRNLLKRSNQWIDVRQKSKSKVTSELSDNKSSSQIDLETYHRNLLKRSNQWIDVRQKSKSKVTSELSDNKSSSQIDLETYHRNLLKRSNQWIDVRQKSKSKVTSELSDNKSSSQEVQQGQDTKKQQDVSKVYNMGQPTSSDPQLGMKRKRAENIMEVTTQGITEEYCKVDLHIETRDDYEDNWELVEHNLVQQFCETL